MKKIPRFHGITGILPITNFTCYMHAESQKLVMPQYIVATSDNCDIAS